MVATGTNAKRSGHKRAHGEGTIRQRPPRNGKPGLWEGQILLPNGVRKSVYGKTQRDVRNKLAALRANLERGIDVGSKQQTLAAFLDSWLETVVLQQCSAKTNTDYGQIVRNHLKPSLGKVKLSALSAQHVQRLLDEKRRQGLSARTVQYIHAVLRAALNDAIEWRLIGWNPTMAVKPPRVVRKEVEGISEEQAHAILDALRGHSLEVLVTTAITTGMRQGELLGLRWANVDLEKQIMSVRNQVKRTKDEYAFTRLKTKESRRVLLLPPSLVTLLREHRGRQLEERLRLGPNWTDLDLVFPSSLGTPMNGTNVTHRFQRRLAEVGLPQMTFHDLRHGAATLMLSQGATLTEIKELLGHSQIAITADIYAHIAPELKRAMAERMERLIGGR
jgi:integrase